MGAAQGFADQPADVVELRIVRGQHPVRAHGVERIDDPARPVGVAGRRLARFPGPGEPLGGRVEPFLDGVQEFLRRFAGPLGGFPDAAHSASSAHSAAGEVQ